MWKFAAVQRVASVARSSGCVWLDVLLCVLVPCLLQRVSSWSWPRQWWPLRGKLATREVVCEWQMPHAAVQRREHRHNLVLIKALHLYVSQQVGGALRHAEICLYRRQLEVQQSRYLDNEDAGSKQKQEAAFDVTALPAVGEAIACDGVRVTRRERVRQSDRTTTIEQKVALEGESQDALDAFVARAFAWYQEHVKRASNKRYMYVPFKCSEGQWQHERFELSEDKTFDSLFFPQKEAVLQLVDNFTHKRGKFAIRGFPKKLGLLLHGPPGTGKTSLIKALAQHLQRHIISIPLSRIKTNSELRECVFRSHEYRDEDATALGFANVVYVLEEVDLISAVVRARCKPQQQRGRKRRYQHVPPEQDALHLGGLLEVLDGVVDCPGRVLIMTTNHPEHLDPALIRSGRFSQTLHMELLRYPEAIAMLEYYFGSEVTPRHRGELRALLESHKMSISPADFERWCGEHATIDPLLQSVQ
jgi:tRNA A37 threonylcarbamoyladenosine biosynthesis protein TsaE